MQNTYEDPVKQISRDKVKGFIGKHYGSKNPNGLSVVCFPGAEVEGEEAIEVKEIYDRLRIPRRKIIGLESDVERVGRLNRARLGIVVEPVDDITYLQAADCSSVISLDYTSNFGDPQRYAIDLIASRKLLGRRGILITNYFGARENKETAFDLSMSHRIKGAGVSTMDYADDPMRVFERLKDQDVRLKDTRSVAIQEGVGNVLRLGEGALNPFLLQDLLGFSREELEDHADDFQEQVKRTKGLKIMGKDKFEVFSRSVSFRLMQSGEFYNTFKRSGIHPNVVSYFWLQTYKPYTIEDHESYSYISNKGSPMLLDCWLVREVETSPIPVLRFRPDVGLDGKRLVDVLPDMSLDKRRRRFDAIHRTVEEFGNQGENVVVERQFLGSSYVPPKRKEKISKSEAIELLAAGVPSAEICEAYSGFSEEQLAGFKAHITRGTYDLSKL